MNLADHLRALEETPSELRDPPQLRGARASPPPDFLEFGSSGRVFTREQMVAELAAEPSTLDLTLSDFSVLAASSGWALVTYRSTRRDPATGRSRTALRSSTWIQHNGRWQVLFHQGTPIPPTALS